MSSFGFVVLLKVRIICPDRYLDADVFVWVQEEGVVSRALISPFLGLLNAEGLKESLLIHFPVQACKGQ